MLGASLGTNFKAQGGTLQESPLPAVCNGAPGVDLQGFCRRPQMLHIMMSCAAQVCSYPVLPTSASSSSTQGAHQGPEQPPRHVLCHRSCLTCLQPCGGLPLNSASTVIVLTTKLGPSTVILHHGFPEVSYLQNAEDGRS